MRGALVEFVKKYTDLVRFLLIGGTNTVIDLALYFVFANLLEIYPVFASIASTGITLIFSFFMNHHFVFRSNKRRRHTLLNFVLITLFNVWVVQSVVIFLAYHSLENISYFTDHLWTLNLVSKITGVSVSMVLNFLGYNKIFKGVSHGRE